MGTVIVFTQNSYINIWNYSEDDEKDKSDNSCPRDEISPPATPTQIIPEQQRSVEDLDPRIFAPTGDIYRSINAASLFQDIENIKNCFLLSYFERRRLDPHLYTMPLHGDVQRRLLGRGGRAIVF